MISLFLPFSFFLAGYVTKNKRAYTYVCILSLCFRMILLIHVLLQAIGERHKGAETSLFDLRQGYLLKKKNV